MTLPAFAAERRSPQSIAPHADVAIDRWDRQTDGQTDARSFHGPCSAYCSGSVSNDAYHTHLFIETLYR